MFWTEGRRTLAALGAAIGIAGGATAATIVVRSNGPSAAAYPPGKLLDPAAQIVLKPGDTVTVLDAGGTRILSGAGKVAVAGRGTANGAGFGTLLASAGVRQSRTGATRGVADGPPRPTNVWYVDTTRGGATCIANPAATMLWRPRFDAAQSVTVTNLTTAAKAGVDFAPGQATRSWPAAVPLADGASYRIDGGAQPVTIRLRMLAPVPDMLDTTAQALLGKGCQNQLDLLVATTTER